MIRIDGSFGEGGGQILRTSLALSLVTKEPVRIENVRARRRKPGLLRQHLTALNAAVAVGQAQVSGAKLGSRTVELIPKRVEPGAYRFDVGTAGSASLVLQTVLPPLMIAEGPSELIITGGTHNPKAPPFEFLARAFLPLLARMGPSVEAELIRPGFYPAGGGELRVRITPCELGRLELTSVSERRLTAQAVVAHLPRKIGERELDVLSSRLDLVTAQVVEDPRSAGPGNTVVVNVESEEVTEVMTGFGEKGVPGWKIAGRVADEVERYLAANVPVGEHLADQLLIPLALGAGGVFTTQEPSLHTTTNIEIIKRFLPVEIDLHPLAPDQAECEVRSSTTY